LSESAKKYLAKDGKTEITIRRATKKDLPALIRNFQKVADERIYILTEQVSKDQRRGIRRRVDDLNSLMLVAEIEQKGKKKIVGSLTLSALGARKMSHVRSLSMAVIDGYREIGVGRALVEYAIDWARKSKGVEKISLSVFSSNERAIELYKKFGFQIEGVLSRQFLLDGKYVDEVQMGRLMKNNS
jgi:RimJ/RimL family protein N-acetyltransferase